MSEEARTRLSELIDILNPLGCAIARAREAHDNAAKSPSGEVAATCGLRTASGPDARRSARGRDLRLPRQGTLLRRIYANREIVVRVLDREFEYEGQTYRSLSAIAKVVTGAHWNGLLFFGLVIQEK